MKSKLLKEKDFGVAIKSSSFKDYALWLGSTAYKGVLGESTQGNGADTEKIEASLWKNLAETNKKILAMTPGSAQEFMEMRVKGYEVLALKNLINLKAEGQESGDFYSSLFISKKIKQKAEKLKGAKDVLELVNSLSDTEYGAALKAGLEEYGRTKSVFPLTLALDKYYFSQLWKSCQKLSGKDKEMARNLIGTEIDGLNILTLLRTIEGGQPEKYLLPCYYKLKKDYLERCLKSRTISELVGKLSESKYGKILSDALPKYEKTKSLLPFELNLKKQILEKNKLALQGDPFHIGTLLGYLKLKEVEVENLRITSVGLSHGFTEEELNNLVVG